MNTSDPQAYATLQREVVRLESIAREVADCRTLLPRDDGAWRGTAHRAFAAEVHALDGQLVAAHHQLALAVTRAKTAIAGMLAHA